MEYPIQLYIHATYLVLNLYSYIYVYVYVLYDMHECAI